jgi:hypothetical protein
MFIFNGHKKSKLPTMCDIFHPMIRLLKHVWYFSENIEQFGTKLYKVLIDFALSTMPFRSGRSVVGFVSLYCEYPVLFFMSLFFFCSFSFGHCIVCPLIYVFWFHLWYLQTVLWSVVVMCILLSLYSIFSRNVIHCVHGESRPIQ